MASDQFCSEHSDFLGPPLPPPQDAASFENRIFVDITGLPGLVGWALNPRRSILIRDMVEASVATWQVKVQLVMPAFPALAQVLAALVLIQLLANVVGKAAEGGLSL